MQDARNLCFGARLVKPRPLSGAVSPLPIPEIGGISTREESSEPATVLILRRRILSR